MTRKKIGAFLLNTVEIYLPMITFLIMFIVFILEIIARYFINYPLDWSYEISTLGYVWTVVLGACYTTRKREHVTFTLIYEKFSVKTRIIVNCIGNILVAVAFSIALYPVFDYINFLHIDKTPILRIPLNIGFLPFGVMLVLVIGHLLYDSLVDIRKLRQKNYQDTESISNNAI